MMKTKLLFALGMASIASGCASVDSNSQVPEKGTSSIALQITKAAGSSKILKDQKLPQGAISNMGAAGYAGYSAGSAAVDHLAGYGFSLASLASGFVIGLLADMKYGWDKGNYIMFLDADKYSSLSKEDICPVVLEKMNSSIPWEQETVQAVTELPLDDTNRFVKARNNGGHKLCVDGFKIDSYEQSKGTIYFNPDQPMVGSLVSVATVSSPIEAKKFYDVTKEKLPANSVIAVRFNYQSSVLLAQRDDRYSRHGITDPNLMYTSPKIRLPEATFISLPVKEFMHGNLYMTHYSAVRDNSNVYYFIRPENGVQVTSSLDELHERTVRIVDKELSKFE